MKIHDAELVFAPCDGRVVVTEMVHESEYLDREMLQISIFMSITNVHMNWVPVGGTVEYFKYHPGRFLVAWHPKSSTENERTTTVVRTPDGKEVLFRQIAGLDRPSYRFLYESRLEGGAKFGLRVHQVRLPHRHPSAEGYRTARGDRGSCRGIANSHRPVEVTYWRRFSRCGTYEYYTSNIASFYGGGGHYGRRPLFDVVLQLHRDLHSGFGGAGHYGTPAGSPDIPRSDRGDGVCRAGAERSLRCW